MTREQAVEVVGNWVRQFSDQRLAEVYAFNEDGKMDAGDYCCCLLGVTNAGTLHLDCEPVGADGDFQIPEHFLAARDRAGAIRAEYAYMHHLVDESESEEEDQKKRNVVFADILRKEMKRRESAREWRDAFVAAEPKVSLDTVVE